MPYPLPRKLRPGFDQLSDDAFIRQKELLNSGFAPFSASTLWRKVKDRSFPAPTKLSAGVTGFQVGRVRAWLKAREAKEVA